MKAIKVKHVRVELLLAWDDNTWDIRAIEVPKDVQDPAKWFMTKGPGLSAQFRDVVAAIVYDSEA